MFLSSSLDFLPESVAARRKDDLSTAIFNFYYDWKYPIVESSGEQDHFSEWRFKKKHDLAGELPLYVVLLVPNQIATTHLKIEVAFRVKFKNIETFEYRALSSADVTFLDEPLL